MSYSTMEKIIAFLKADAAALAETMPDPAAVPATFPAYSTAAACQREIAAILVGDAGMKPLPVKYPRKNARQAALLQAEATDLSWALVSDRDRPGHEARAARIARVVGMILLWAQHPRPDPKPGDGPVLDADLKFVQAIVHELDLLKYGDDGAGVSTRELDVRVCRQRGEELPEVKPVPILIQDCPPEREAAHLSALRENAKVCNRDLDDYVRGHLADLRAPAVEAASKAAAADGRREGGREAGPLGRQADAQGRRLHQGAGGLAAARRRRRLGHRTRRLGPARRQGAVGEGRAQGLGRKLLRLAIHADVAHAPRSGRA